jgi:hypothetical protein
MKKIRLPNGKTVACLDRLTAIFCCNEIYGDNDYLREGSGYASGTQLSALHSARFLLSCYRP